MAAENSFDIACKVDMQEVANAVNQAKREIETRYDLKGSKNDIVQEKMDLVLTSGDEMKLKAVLDILQSKLHRRGIACRVFESAPQIKAVGVGINIVTFDKVTGSTPSVVDVSSLGVESLCDAPGPPSMP